MIPTATSEWVLTIGRDPGEFSDNATVKREKLGKTGRAKS